MPCALFAENAAHARDGCERGKTFGLVKQYQDSVDENGVYDISQEDATQYLIDNGITPFGIMTKKEFYDKDCTVGGKKYDSYADFIDDLVLTEKRQGFRDTAKTGFRY